MSWPLDRYHWKAQAAVALVLMTCGTIGGLSGGMLAAVSGAIVTLLASILLCRGVWRGLIWLE